MAKLRFLPPNARSWEPRGVLAGAYRGSDVEDRETLTHAVWLDDQGNMIGSKSVCRRIDDGHLVDAYGMRGDEEVTCPVCRERIERSGLPRGSSIGARDRARRRSRDPQSGRSKPIQITRWRGKWRVLVEADAAKRFGARGSRVRDWKPGATIAVSRVDGKLDLVPEGLPAAFTLEEAKDIAHKVGRYMLGFGDFVDAYTNVVRDAPAHSRDRRDPPKPGEFERHARAPLQKVFVFAKNGDVIVVFPGVRNRRGETMVYRESGATYEYDALGHYVRDRAWERVGPDHRSVGEANRLLNHLIDDHGWRIAAQVPRERDRRYTRRHA